jgi:hypothetical protein
MSEMVAKKPTLSRLIVKKRAARYLICSSGGCYLTIVRETHKETVCILSNCQVPTYFRQAANYSPTFK